MRTALNNRLLPTMGALLTNFSKKERKNTLIQKKKKSSAWKKVLKAQQKLIAKAAKK